MMMMLPRIEDDDDNDEVCGRRELEGREASFVQRVLERPETVLVIFEGSDDATYMSLLVALARWDLGPVLRTKRARVLVSRWTQGKKIVRFAESIDKVRRWRAEVDERLFRRNLRSSSTSSPPRFSYSQGYSQGGYSSREDPSLLDAQPSLTPPRLELEEDLMQRSMSEALGRIVKEAAPHGSVYTESCGSKESLTLLSMEGQRGRVLFVVFSRSEKKTEKAASLGLYAVLANGRILSLLLVDDNIFIHASDSEARACSVAVGIEILGILLRGLVLAANPSLDGEKTWGFVESKAFDTLHQSRDRNLAFARHFPKTQFPPPFWLSTSTFLLAGDEANKDTYSPFLANILPHLAKRLKTNLPRDFYSLDKALQGWETTTTTTTIPHPGDASTLPSSSSSSARGWLIIRRSRKISSPPQCNKLQKN